MQKVELINNGSVVRKYFVPALSAAHNGVLTHMSADRRHRATVTDDITGALRVYFWLGDKLNISLL